MRTLQPSGACAASGTANSVKTASTNKRLIMSRSPWFLSHLSVRTTRSSRTNAAADYTRRYGPVSRHLLRGNRGPAAAQHVLLDLARGGLGQLGDEGEPARNF